MTKIYDLVKSILEKYPESRDSDKLLMWMIWSKVLYGTPTGYDQIHLDYRLFYGLPNTETIRRTRQKIMELNIELRGSSYIQKLRRKKQLSKGTFIYREKVIPTTLITIEEKPRNSAIW